MIENTDDRIWSVDQNYRLLVANPAFARGIELQIGHPLALGESVFDDPFPPAARAYWQPLYDRALAGETFTVQVASSLRPGGTLECYLNPIRDANGAVTGVAGRAVDITERLQAEQDLHDTLQRLRLATNAADIGIWSWNFADDSLNWDERLCDFYGVSAAERTSGLYFDIWRARMHPDDLEETEKTLGRARRLGTDWDAIFRIVLPSGQMHYIYSAAVVETNRQGKSVRSWRNRWRRARSNYKRP